jgi:hypothetical protein
LLSVVIVIVIVFGALGMCCGMAGGASLAMMPIQEEAQKDNPFTRGDAYREMMRFQDEMMPLQVTVILLAVLLSFTLCIAGVAAYRLRPLGRRVLVGALFFGVALELVGGSFNAYVSYLNIEVMRRMMPELSTTPETATEKDAGACGEAGRGAIADAATAGSAQSPAAEPTGAEPTGENPTGEEVTGAESAGAEQVGPEATGAEPESPEPESPEPTAPEPARADADPGREADADARKAENAKKAEKMVSGMMSIFGWIGVIFSIGWALSKCIIYLVCALYLRRREVVDYFESRLRRPAPQTPVIR